VFGHTAADLKDGNKKMTNEKRNRLLKSIFLNLILRLKKNKYGIGSANTQYTNLNNSLSLNIL